MRQEQETQEDLQRALAREIVQVAAERRRDQTAAILLVIGIDVALVLLMLL